MQRRNVLKAIAVGGLVGSSSGVAAGLGSAGGKRPIEDVDTLYVLRGDEVVETINNPTLGTLRSAQASLGDDESISTDEVGTTCYTHCKEDCDVFCKTDCEWATDCSEEQWCCHQSVE